MPAINLFHMLWLCVAAMMAAVLHLYVSHRRTMRRLEEVLRGRRSVAVDAAAEAPVPPEPVAAPPVAPAAAEASPVQRLAGLDALGPRPAPGAGIGAALAAGARAAGPGPEKPPAPPPAVDLFGDSAMDDEEQRVTAAETAAPEPRSEEPEVAPSPRPPAGPREIPPERLPRGMDGNLPRFSAAEASNEASLDSLFEEVEQSAAAPAREPAPAAGRGGLLMQRLSAAAPIEMDDSRNVESIAPPEPPPPVASLADAAPASPAPPLEVEPPAEPAAETDRSAWERLEKLAQPAVEPDLGPRDPLEEWARSGARPPQGPRSRGLEPVLPREEAPSPDGGWGLLEPVAPADAKTEAPPAPEDPGPPAAPVEEDAAAGWGAAEPQTIEAAPAPDAVEAAPAAVPSRSSDDDAWAMAFRSTRKNASKDVEPGDDLFSRRLTAQLAMLTDARDEVDGTAPPAPAPAAPAAEDPRTATLKGREQLLERFYSFYQSVVDESAHRQEKPRAEAPADVFRRVLEKARGAGVAAERGEETGESMLAAGRFEDAAAWYRARVDAGTATEDDFRQLGKALANAGKMDEAVATWEQMLKRYPDARGGLAGLGELLAGSARPKPSKKLSFRKKSV